MSRPFIPALAGWGILPPMRASLSLLLVAACLVPSPGATEDAGLSSRDHDRVRAAVARGEMVPLETVLAEREELQRRFRDFTQAVKEAALMRPAAPAKPRKVTKWVPGAKIA